MESLVFWGFLFLVATQFTVWFIQNRKMDLLNKRLDQQSWFLHDLKEERTALKIEINNLKFNTTGDIGSLQSAMGNLAADVFNAETKLASLTKDILLMGAFVKEPQTEVKKEAKPEKKAKKTKARRVQK